MSEILRFFQMPRLTVGGPDEASEYFAECGPVWRSTPGAIEWLSKLTATLPANEG